MFSEKDINKKEKGCKTAFLKTSRPELAARRSDSTLARWKQQRRCKRAKANAPKSLQPGGPL